LKVKIVSDAESQYARKLSASLPSHITYTRHDRDFLAILKHLQGKEWPEALDILRGLDGVTYIIFDVASVLNKSFKSKIVAVPNAYVEKHIDDHIMHDVPIATGHIQYYMYLKAGLKTVEILTVWVDAFCAFVSV